MKNYVDPFESNEDFKMQEIEEVGIIVVYKRVNNRYQLVYESKILKPSEIDILYNYLKYVYIKEDSIESAEIWQYCNYDVYSLMEDIALIRQHYEHLNNDLEMEEEYNKSLTEEYYNHNKSINIDKAIDNIMLEMDKLFEE